MKISINRSFLELVVGDITDQETDAIVNAANSALAGGLGVDGAIHRAGGPQIMAECRKIGGCPTGEARLTLGGNLKAKYVIHAVGPIYKDGTEGEAELLSSAYDASLQIARNNKIKSVAFPSLSTGAYGYPLELAAPIALQTVIDELKQNEGIDLVRIVLFHPDIYSIYETELKNLVRK
jgi:O-acetyl-ADP-ribose deacetylase (regulator of RNase III)